MQSSWNPEDDPIVISSMTELGFDFLDMMPTKYRRNKVCRSVSGWRAKGIEIEGLQGFLFGRNFQICTCENSISQFQDAISYFSDCQGLAEAELIVGAPSSRLRNGEHKCGEAEFVAALQHLGSCLPSGMRMSVENLDGISGDLMLSDIENLIDNLAADPKLGIVFDLGNFRTRFDNFSQFFDALRVLDIETISHFQWRETPTSNMKELSKLLLELETCRADLPMLALELELTSVEDMREKMKLISNVSNR